MQEMRDLQTGIEEYTIKQYDLQKFNNLRFSTHFWQIFKEQDVDYKTK